MARINLLPWREAERKQRQKELGHMVIFGVLFAALAVIGVHMQLQSLVDAQEQRNAYLKKEIDVVERQIREIRDLEKTKNNLLARMNIIQELQSSRPLIVHLMDEIVATLPGGVYLQKIEQSGSSFSLEGMAQSNARVSALMRNIEDSPWVGNPKLNLIESEKESETGYSRFILKANQVSQDEGEKQ